MVQRGELNHSNPASFTHQHKGPVQLTFVVALSGMAAEFSNSSLRLAAATSSARRSSKRLRRLSRSADRVSLGLAGRLCDDPGLSVLYFSAIRSSRDRTPVPAEACRRIIKDDKVESQSTTCNHQDTVKVHTTSHQHAVCGCKNTKLLLFRLIFLASLYIFSKRKQSKANGFSHLVR